MDWVNMSRKDLEDLIEQVVAREVKKQLAAIKQPPVKKEKLVDVKELCRELKVSRQTINNWKKSRIGFVFNPCIHKMGGKVLYDITAIRQVLKEHKEFFGNGRNYGYKYEATVTDEQRRVDRYNHIRWQAIQGNEITEEDRIFYEQECKWRGEQSRLK